MERLRPRGLKCKGIVGQNQTISGCHPQKSGLSCSNLLSRFFEKQNSENQYERHSCYLSMVHPLSWNSLSLILFHDLVPLSFLWRKAFVMDSPQRTEQTQPYPGQLVCVCRQRPRFLTWVMLDFALTVPYIASVCVRGGSNKLHSRKPTHHNMAWTVLVIGTFSGVLVLPRLSSDRLQLIGSSSAHELEY